MPQTKSHVMLVRVEPELHKRFLAAIEADAKIHNFEEQHASECVRDMMRDYCERVESTAKSAVAVEGAKVLSRGRRRA